MIQSSEGLQLFTKNYLVQNAKASVLITHGLAEHCGRYAHVAQSLNSIACNVYTFDLRGHGRSEGERGFIKNFDEYRLDIEAVFQIIPKDLPIFLLGHSMGGLITYNFLQFRERNNVRGVVLSAPGLAPGKEVNWLTQKIVLFFGSIAPKVKTVKLDAKTLTHDPAEIVKCENDPLVYHLGTKAGLGKQLLKTILAVKPTFKDFNYPVLIMQGSHDTLVNPQGASDLFNAAASTDKALKIWKGAFHEIFNETNKQEVMEFQNDWILNRL